MADDRESNLTNLYSTTLSSSVGPTDLTFPVESMVGAPASPCFIFIRSTDGSQWEIIDADGTFTGSSFVATAIGKRYLTGSSAASGLTHAEGSIVEVRPVAQYWQQVHDRIDAVGASGAGAVAQSLYDENSILKADADNTPEALVVAEDRLVGRLAGGEITGLTSAQVAGLLETDLSGTYAPLAKRSCRAHRATALSVPDSTFTVVGLDGETHDSGGMHDLVTNNERILLDQVGLWLVIGAAGFSSGTGTRTIGLNRNGTTQTRLDESVTAASASGDVLTISDVFIATAVTDYASMVVRQQSGGSLGLLADSQQTFLSATFLGTLA